MKIQALLTSESAEWYTPSVYIEAARELMGAIDVDPASNEFANQVVKARTFYTPKTNGLTKRWPGRVWLNPPYKGDGPRFIARLLEQYQSGVTTEAVLLVNANTEATWFQPLYDYLICFTDHRIRFYNQNGASSQPTQGNAFVYFGRQRQRFIEVFRRFGTVVTVAYRAPVRTLWNMEDAG